ncbi:MAG: helix-turn-helix domain-containing protein, partial [Chloroflexi bacterium]|nr:helix-turn-helix domain-containing protein [Chloroflexota bacterium]
LALELRRGGAAVDEAAGAGRAAARALPPAGPPWVSIVARQVMLDQPSTVEQRERLRQELRRLEPARRLSLRGDAASLELRLVAVAADDDPLGVGVAARVHGVARRPVAVSRPFREPEQRALAEAEARATLEAVEILRSDESTADRAVGPGPPVARADRLPAYRLLGSLHDIADGQRQARALLAPLFEGRPAAVHARLATLRAVLDGPGLRDAARALGVHRNSLTYRVGRIEAAAGWDLSDPALRFALGIAVRIVQHAQTSGPPGALEG